MKANCVSKQPELSGLRVSGLGLGFGVNMGPEQLEQAPNFYTVDLHTASGFNELKCNADYYSIAQ